MKLKFTLVLIFLTTCVFGQESKDKVTGITISEQNPVIRINCAASRPAIPPLFIVDGIPLDTSELRTLNTNDILEIEILKDVNSALISCNRSNSGIVLITTKSSQTREFIIKDQFTSDPVPFAYVTFIPIENEADSIMLSTNEKGKVSTHLLRQKKNYKVKISSVGYKGWEGNFKNDTRELKEFKLSRNIVSNSVVTVIAYSRTMRCGYSGCLFAYNKEDSSLSRSDHFKIFPNPVSRGSALNMEWQVLSDTRLKSQLLSLDGKILYSQNLTAYKGINRLSFPTESKWVPGVYFIRVMDENGKPIQQEKILIQ